LMGKESTVSRLDDSDSNAAQIMNDEDEPAENSAPVCEDLRMACNLPPPGAISSSEGSCNDSQNLVRQLRRRFSRQPWRRRWWWMDSTSICYGVISLLMISVGILISVLTSKSDALVITYDRRGTSPQVWIVGPIFVICGVLVLMKAITRLYKMFNPEPFNFFSTNSSQSVDGTCPVLPSYSMALDAPIPSTVIEDEDKSFEPISTEDIDHESSSFFNMEPPPTYTEALQILRQSIRRREMPETRNDLPSTSSNFFASRTSSLHRLTTVCRWRREKVTRRRAIRCHSWAGPTSTSN
ncbi:hypothetical protein T07_5754, partial [Trichinella nelsoni]